MGDEEAAGRDTVFLGGGEAGASPDAGPESPVGESGGVPPGEGRAEGEGEGADAPTVILSGRTVALPPGSCPRCRAANPPQQPFCSSCGFTLRDLEIRDHRHELTAASGGRGTFRGRSAFPQAVRRTTEYLGSGTGRIQPVPSPAPLAPARGNRPEGKEGDTALVVGICLLCLLGVAVLVLVILVMHYL